LLGLVTLSAAALSGCAPPTVSREAFDYCDFARAKGWELIAPPENKLELLSLPTKKGDVNSDLGPAANGPAPHEHWFRLSENEIAACRHLVGKGLCGADATSVRFVKDRERWSAPDGVFETICVTSHD